MQKSTSIIYAVLCTSFFSSFSLKAEQLALPDGESLFYEKVGSGLELIVVAAHSYTFPALVALEDSRWTIIAYDPRGRGQSSYVEDGSTIHILQDVQDLEFLRAFFEVEKTHLLGFSFAGRIVSAYASQYPENVERLAMLAPAPISFSHNYTNPRFERRPMPAEFDQAIQGIMKQRQKERHVITPQAYCYEERTALFPMAWASNSDAKVMLSEYATRLCRPEYVNEWPVYFSRYRELKAPSREGLFDETFFDNIGAPTLLVHGTEDRNSPLGGSHYWAWRIEDARIAEIEGQAHASHIEVPEIVTGLFRTFFSGSWPDTAFSVTESPIAEEDEE